MALPAITLDDKYTLDRGRIYATGIQALLRVLIVQRRRDVAAGRDTAGFISGYRGSPMTAMDNECWRAASHLEEHHIHFWPGLNEHMAATAIWGTQQVGFFGDAKYDGVYSMWYGKGPGLDQSLDAMRQANYHGTTPHGGVLVAAGDDPAMRSTVDAYHSELLFEDLLMPVLYPADIQEVFDLGLYGYALSRFCGAWVGYKLLPETIETAASIDSSHDRLDIVTPEFELPPDGIHSRNPDFWYHQEPRLRNYKLPAAVAFGRANRLNYVSHESPRPRLGIAAMGKTWRDTLHALGDLGIDRRTAADLGITILKVGMPFPADDDLYREFADGLEEILVIEDKREQIEHGFLRACYALPEARRPRIVGRRDETGRPLVSKVGDLSADKISRVIAHRIAPFHTSDRIAARLALLDATAKAAAERDPAELSRLPYFCSGCPHNRSTIVPDGSRGVGGVGCHFMAFWMERNVHNWTQMGGEGVTWIGQAPFVTTPHLFQQLGDGTYYHSGTLAIRAAVAAKVNITYKILYNDAVAMTGGQPVDGPLDVPAITHQVRSEGIGRIAIVTDEPEKYDGVSNLASGTTVHRREEMDLVQKELREIPGVTILIYDQTCAAEKRRRRKRGKFPDPPKRIFINERVCEGCGDCGEVSNCLSILPLETEYGRKRTIDQSSCNKDYSCVDGLCPSFVTIHGGELRKGTGIGDVPTELINLPDPEIPAPPPEASYGILITGIGGTGVVTTGALLGMAAHVEGKGVSIVDQLGFAQKGGPVMTHVRIAAKPDDINTARINLGSADLILSGDLLVTGGDEALATIDPGRTRVVVNTHETITGDFTRRPDLRFPAESMTRRIVEATQGEQLTFLDATTLAARLLGNSIASNLFMVGFAWQRGAIPLEEESLLRAIELNGVQIEWNKQAFQWGRLAAHDLEAVVALAGGTSPDSTTSPNSTGSTGSTAQTLDTLIARRSRDLTEYQNEAYARRYRNLVAGAQAAESALAGSPQELTAAVARYAYKLMAYKDEYEVARLHADPELLEKIAEQFEGDYKIEFNLAPPTFARIDKATGRPKKIRFGAWMLHGFRLLAGLKFLRGTPIDPFGWTAERKMERRLIAEYETRIEDLVRDLSEDRHPIAVEIASLPEQIRGYGEVKEAHLEQVRAAETDLLARWRDPVAEQIA